MNHMKRMEIEMSVPLIQVMVLTWSRSKVLVDGRVLDLKGGAIQIGAIQLLSQAFCSFCCGV